MDNVKCDKDMGDDRRAIPLVQPPVYTSHDHFEKRKMTLVTKDIVVEK
jgi:hypothetical protein